MLIFEQNLIGWIVRRGLELIIFIVTFLTLETLSGVNVWGEYFFNTIRFLMAIVIIYGIFLLYYPLSFLFSVILKTGALIEFLFLFLHLLLSAVIFYNGFSVYSIQNMIHSPMIISSMPVFLFHFWLVFSRANNKTG